MSTYIFVLGKDPELSRAELESRFIIEGRCEHSAHLMGVSLERDLTQKEFDTLGGQVKAAKVFGECDREGLVATLADYLAEGHESGKLNYGISLYGMPERSLRPLLLELKKEFKKNGINSRFANQGFKNISVAQHKGLKEGMELLVCKNGKKFVLAEVITVQDIDAYSKRDYKKPFRDMKVGMLPPKLAQILISLTGSEGRIWDPFCGGGVLIMEGLLMGHDMLGSDINEKTLQGAKQNLDWLRREFGVKAEGKLIKHDARDPLKGEKVDAIACEGYLGPPQTRPGSEKELAPVIRELTALYTDFFKALGKFKGPVVIALPFFRSKGGELHLDKVVKAAEKLGFKKDLQLNYARVDQFVGREILRFNFSGV